jgi:hypothetical protein
MSDELYAPRGRSSEQAMLECRFATGDWATVAGVSQTRSAIVRQGPRSILQLQILMRVSKTTAGESCKEGGVGDGDSKTSGRVSVKAGFCQAAASFCANRLR